MSDLEPKRTAAEVIGAFAKQVRWCESLGSPFTAGVLAAIADDIAAGRAAADLTDGWRGDPIAAALPLRMAGALHALVLTGQAPHLAACYPPQAAAPEAQLRSAVNAALEAHRGFVAAFLASPPQTNEVGRSGVLLGGFLEIAARTGLPLRLLEIGASAGLNSLWDRYHYQIGDRTWGDPLSPVRLAPTWQGPLPPLDTPLEVRERFACDLAPIDLEDAAQRLRLKAYVWADQRERLARLEGAITIARASGQRVERADAVDWVRDRLPSHGAPCASVLFHSIMWQYLPAPTQAAIRRLLQEAGRRATPSHPLAWLRFEPSHPESKPQLHLTLWPDEFELCLADALPHGTDVLWSDREAEPHRGGDA